MVNEITKKELIEKINNLRNELINTAITEGMNSYKTIQLSEKLDRLIIRYQKSNFD